MSGKPRPCGCKGYRSCLICEKECDVKAAEDVFLSKEKLDQKGIPSYAYCLQCGKAWRGWDCDKVAQSHPQHSGDSLEFPGIYVMLDFLSEEERACLMQQFDSLPWDSSQSGRRKQNFGPKCNFKKTKLQQGAFEGFPAFSRLFYEKLKDVDIMANYKTIEQCSLEYDPERGASIEPHIDDCWVWGERVVTINLLGNSVLTMTKYKGGNEKYNLHLVPNALDGKDELPDVCVRIPMPAGSLMVIHGAARYQWEHCVLRSDITHRRVCIALREFTPPFLDGSDEIAERILQAAAQFF